MPNGRLIITHQLPQKLPCLSFDIQMRLCILPRPNLGLGPPRGCKSCLDRRCQCSGFYCTCTILLHHKLWLVPAMDTCLAFLLSHFSQGAAPNTQLCSKLHHKSANKVIGWILGQMWGHVYNASMLKASSACAAVPTSAYACPERLADAGQSTPFCVLSR